MTRLELMAMSMHETEHVRTKNGNFYVIRVPGGWVYNVFSKSGEGMTGDKDTYQPVFVPE